MLKVVNHYVTKDLLKLLRSELVPGSQRLCSVDKMASTKAVPESKLHHHEPHSDMVWVDCEMSGLDVDKDQLLEVAVIITDSELNELETCGPLVIKTDPTVLENMDAWCRKTHKKTGLTDACLQSQLTVEDVDEKLHQLLTSRSIRVAALAGNSVSYDRQFLKKYCPKFGSLLHYRLIDVSSIKEVIRRWYPSEPNFQKKLSHRALDDIRDSIEELRFYRKRYFKDPSQL